jgi:hypothetical protein
VSIPTGFLYNTPLTVPQRSGPPVRANESHRVFSVVAYGGHLHVVEASGPCASDCDAQGTDANNLFYLFDIATTTMTLTENVKVAHPTLSLLFPTLATDGRGNVGIGATGSSSSEYPSVYLFAHRATGPAGKISGPFLAHAGTDAYTCTKGPALAGTGGWGTYSATVQDGSDPMRLWTLQEYAGSATPCVWKTRVIAFRLWSPSPAPKGIHHAEKGKQVSNP